MSTIFSSYLSGKLPSNPWSEEPLRAETTSISASLIRLNDERHWWTVGSQPAVDGAPSAHPVHGFGPKGGYVYQKAFVEFFLSEEELDEFERRSAEEERGRKERGEADEGCIKWFAGNRKGDSRTNMRKGDVNAVTWGVFGGKEIVTTTLIEEMSFKAWNVRRTTLSSSLLSLTPSHSNRRRPSPSGSNGRISTLPDPTPASSSASSQTLAGSSPSRITTTRTRWHYGVGCWSKSDSPAVRQGRGGCRS